VGGCVGRCVRVCVCVCVWAFEATMWCTKTIVVEEQAGLNSSFDSSAAPRLPAASASGTFHLHRWWRSTQHAHAHVQTHTHTPRQGTLLSLVPRLPANAEILAWATSFAELALRCTQVGGKMKKKGLRRR